MENLPTFSEWALALGIIVGMITILALLWRFARWTGKVDTSLKGIDDRFSEVENNLSRIHSRLDSIFNVLAGNIVRIEPAKENSGLTVTKSPVPKAE